MGVKIGDYDLDTNNISPADVEKLRAMLPTELQQPGKLTQLEIILEAIHYIQLLQNKLTTKEPWEEPSQTLLQDVERKYFVDNIVKTDYILIIIYFSCTIWHFILEWRLNLH